MSASADHTWRFFRAGGFDQVRIETGADLVRLEKLDQKLWVALACPTSGLQFDAKTLALIDTDKDGRIRAPELLAAVKWTCACVKNPGDILKGESALPLAAINEATPEGKNLLASARHILANLGKENAPVITVEDTADTSKIFNATSFNGDGIVTAEVSKDATLLTVIADIMSCVGSEMDRSGKPGVSQLKADQFFAEAKAYAAWRDEAQGNTAILPLGENTAAAATAYAAVKTKVEDYFVRCRMAAFDARSVGALNREEKEYLVLAAKDLNLKTTELAGFPLARIEAQRPLPLLEELNPAWSDAVTQFLASTVRPLLGDKVALTQGEWEQLQVRLAPYETWQKSKVGTQVEKLGIARVKEILGGDSQRKLTALIAQDKALEIEIASIASVERLVRYYCGLNTLLHNFVSFRDFYSRRGKAIFQAGTLYLDQRSCDLCLAVGDVGKHALMAGLAGTYLAYCDCVRKSTGESLQIVAAFTDGDSDNLMAGRNGVFYDRQGRDWDATISKIIDNPISIRQAFWSPYKKLIRFIEENIAKRAADAENAANDQMAAAAKMAVEADKARAIAEAEKAKAAAIARKKIDVGVVAALGVALGSIGTAVSALATGIVRLPASQIPLVFLGLITLISGPSMIIAWLKLRKRNLGPILDANGWAVNAKARINVPFGSTLTQVAALPPDSQRDLIDPYADKKSFIPALLGIAAGLWIIYSILNNVGLIYDWSGGWLGDKREREKGVAVEKAAITNAPPAAAK
jgi:hypothetical protein